VSGAGEAVELVILDCDGVLVDSERLAVRVEARLISAMGWEIDEDEVLRRFVGRSDAHMRREIERELGRPVPEWDARYASALSAAFRAELEAVPGVVAALDRLTVPTCVASSGTFEKMALSLGSRASPSASPVASTAPPRSQPASRPPTCSCTRPPAWGWCRRAASSSRTAQPACRRHGRPACARSATPAA
jgi:hypothetical protein